MKREEANAADSRRMERQISQIAQGDKEAFASLYEETRTAVFAFLLSYLGRHDAEDALQDTYLSAYRSAGAYRPQGTPMAWLLGVAKNTARRRLREDRRETVLPEESWDSMEEEADGLSSEDRTVLHSLLQRLSAEEYRIVALHAVSGLKFREIAEALPLPLSTVLSKYHRAMKKLKKAWEEESADE